jgi:outer membrane protein assembly complex protein YaeT
VEIEGDPRETREQVLRRLDAAEGEPYRRPELESRLADLEQRLQKRGYYLATASHRVVEAEDLSSVNLTLDINAGPVVTVRFEGDPLPEDRRRELAPIEREASVDEDLLEDSESRIERYLRQEGYWKADAVVSRTEADGTLTVVFRVTKGLQYRVAESVEIRGNAGVPADELRPLVTLKPGDVFIESQLDATASAITDLYRRRGFAQVEVKPDAIETDPGPGGEGRIRPAILIAEGPRTTIADVRIQGNALIPVERLRPLITVTAGSPYYAPRLIADRDTLLLEYLNLGFAAADVKAVPKVSEDGTRADVVFEIQEGPQTLVDHILIVGNRRTKPDVILRELRLRPGEPLGLEDQIESQRRLSALGLFRRVRITELTHGLSNRHDILVTVDEGPATTIGYGGGAEVSQRLRATGPEGEAREEREFAPRGFFEIGRRNLGGKNRSVSLYTRASLRPRDAPDDPEADGTGLEFREYRVVGTYREPRALGASDLTVTAVAEQGVRSSFNFNRRGVNLDMVRRLTPAVRVSGRYSFSTTKRFDERLSEEDQSTIDRLFPQVRLSGFSGAIARDTRDDVLEPTRGLFLSAEGTVATRLLGGEVGFMKSYVQGFWFKQLAGRRGFVFATRGALGLADGFAREVEGTVDGQPIDTPVTIEDLPQSERFFAGGDTTIRGYALDSVGAPNTITPNGFPTGGNAVVLLNAELRVPVWRDFGAAVFADGGNVFRRVTDFDMGQLSGSLGFGVRYRSPLGPIRLDLGFKLDRRMIGGVLEDRTALHFSIGQAF